MLDPFSGCVVPFREAFAQAVGGGLPPVGTPPLLLECMAMKTALPALPRDALSPRDQITLTRLGDAERVRHWRASGCMNAPDEDRDAEEHLCGLMTEFINENVVMRLLWETIWPLMQAMCPDIARGDAWDILRDSTMHTSMKESYETMTASAAAAAAAATGGDGTPPVKRQRLSDSSSGDDDETTGDDDDGDDNVDNVTRAGMISIKTLNGLVVICLVNGGGKNMHGRRASVSKGYPGSGGEIWYNPVLRLCDSVPVAVQRGNRKTVRDTDIQSIRNIAASMGGMWIAPSDTYHPVRVSLQAAAFGGGMARVRFIALGVVLHAAPGIINCPLRVLVMALTSTGCTGVDGEMPKNVVNRRQYVSVKALLMLLTEYVTGASDVQPAGVDVVKAKACWNTWVGRASEVAQPRMKGGTLDLVMRSLMMLEFANYHVDIDVAKVSKLAVPHMDRVALFLTYPIDNCDEPGAAIALVAGCGDWNVVADRYLAGGSHWGAALAANKLAVSVVNSVDRCAAADVVRFAALEAVRRLVMHTLVHNPGSAIWETFANVVCLLSAHGVYLNSSVWPLVDAESGLHPLLTIVCEEACRVGLVDSNYMVSLLSVDSVDAGTVYTVLVVPGTAITLLALRGLQFNGPPGIVRTSAHLVLNSPGGDDNLPQLVALKVVRDAPWPMDESFYSSSASSLTTMILSTCGHNGLCFRAKALDVAYCDTSRATKNRRQLSDPLADLELSAWRLEADQQHSRRAVVNGDLDTTRTSLSLQELNGATITEVFVETVRNAVEATRLVIMPLVTTEPGMLANVTPLYLVYRKLSTEYYELFRGRTEPLAAVVEAARAMCGDDADIDTRRTTFKQYYIELFFSDSVVHCSVSPTAAGQQPELGIDDSLLDAGDGGPMTAKTRCIRNSVGVSVISLLRKTRTVLNTLKHLAWQAKMNENTSNLSEAIDNGVAGAAHILCTIMGLPTYGNGASTLGFAQAERSMIAQRAKVSMLEQSIKRNEEELGRARDDREIAMVASREAMNELSSQFGDWIDGGGAAISGVTAAMDNAVRVQEQFTAASQTAKTLEDLLGK
jgi:hypothetical protein